MKEVQGIEIIKGDPLLQKAFKWIVENNRSNYAPYHNINHLLTVLKWCEIIAHGEQIYYDQRRELRLAALFHDVNHSMGEKEDFANVQEAMHAVDTFLRSLDDEDLKNKVDLDRVRRLIKVTEFPYVQPESSLNAEQQIIRDADMMQAFEYNWINQITMGLAAEMKMDIKEFIPKQRLFIESTQFRTRTARAIRDERWPQIMNEFRILEVSMGLT